MDKRIKYMGNKRTVNAIGDNIQIANTIVEQGSLILKIHSKHTAALKSISVLLLPFTSMSFNIFYNPRLNKPLCLAVYV